ncbi:MAG: divalent metal cation transporter [Acidimicrobiia bacterium]
MPDDVAPTQAPLPVAATPPEPRAEDQDHRGRGLLRLTTVRRRFGWREWLMVVGPGLVAANAGNDAGGIATYASAGAEFAYRTLFVMTLLTVALVVVQEMVARLAARTGQGPRRADAEELPLRTAGLRAVVPVRERRPRGERVRRASARRRSVSSACPGTSSSPSPRCAIWSLRALRQLPLRRRALILTLAFIRADRRDLAHPDWSEVFATYRSGPTSTGTASSCSSSCRAHRHHDPPYMQFYGAGAVADKGGGPDTYRLARVDAVTGSIAACLVSAFIIIATAAAIGGSGPLTSAAEAATALEPVAGRFAQQLFAIGLIGASALAAVVVPLSTAYGLSEAAGVERSVSRTFREAPVFLGLFTGQIVIGAAVSLLPGNLIDLLIGTQVLNGLITPIILAFILVLANRRSLLGDAANGRIRRVLGVVIVAVVGTLSLVVVGQSLLGIS